MCTATDESSAGHAVLASDQTSLSGHAVAMVLEKYQAMAKEPIRLIAAI
jgi:hypothetical protein